MKKTLYVIFDAKAQTYTNPVAYHNDAEAIRDFTTVCNDRNCIYGVHPTDFELVRIGDFDPFTGMVNPLLPEVIMQGFACVYEGGELSGGLPPEAKQSVSDADKKA